MNHRTPPQTHPVEFGPMPAQTVSELANGLVYHRFNGGDQPICSLKILFSGGRAEIGNDIVSRVALGATADGAGELTDKELGNIIDFNGIRLSSACHDHYSSLTVSALSERLIHFLPTLSEMLGAPTFPEQRLSTLLLSAKAQIETSRKEIMTIADEEFDKVIMGSWHPLAQAVRPEIVDGISRDDVAGTFRRLANPSGAHAFLSGYFTSELEMVVAEMLQGIEQQSAKGYEPCVMPFSASEPGTVTDNSFPDSLQCAVVAGLPAVGRAHADYNDLRLCVMALGGYFNSRLMANLREKEGLTYGISASLMGTYEGAYVKIAAQCDKKSLKLLIEGIKREIRQLADNPPRGEELERLRLHAATSLAKTLDTPTAIMGYYATQIIAGTPSGYFEAQQEAIQRLDTEKIAETARSYLDAEKLRIAVAS